MNFDIEGAKKEGYTDTEIAQHLAIKSNFDYTGALKEGYTDSDIISHLSKKAVAKPKEQPKVEEPPKELSWKDVPGEMISNTPSSAYEFGKSLYQAVSSPIETTKNIGKVLAGTLSIVLPGTPVEDSSIENEEYAKNVGQFFVDRYGGLENIKKTMAKDPVGFATDVASTFSGVGLAARGTQVGSIAAKAGAMIDPLSVAGKAVSTATKPIVGSAKGLVGLTTGKGHAVIEDAVKNTSDFRSAMRGGTTGEEVVNTSKSGVHQIANERSQLYRQRLEAIEQMPNPPSLDIVRSTRELGDAMKDFDVKPIVDRTGNITGLDFSRSAIKGNAKAQADFNNLIDLFKNAYNDKQFYSTPAGMDTLKKQIGNLYSETSQGRAAVKRVYDKTRQQLVDRVPGYLEMVGDYEKTTKLITEMESALGLKNKTSVDTALRKLNTAMKEDQDFRRSLISTIEKETGKDISSIVSGLQMQSWTSGALRSAGATVGGMMSIIYGNPWGVLLAGMASPRLVGETITLLSQGAKASEKLRKIAPPPVRQGLYQAGRLGQPALPQAMEE